MEIWISKLLGPTIVALALAMIIDPKGINELSRRFLEDKPLILISGVLAMLAGLAIINNYHVWKWDWALIITLFGWALVISGATRIILPQMVTKIGSTMINSPRVTVISGVAWAVLGAFLIFKGYVH